MMKCFIFSTVALLLAIGKIPLLAQINRQPDKNAVKLLAATQAMNYFADTLNLISRREQLPRVLSDYLLDWKITNGICSYVTPINLSFRKAIIDRVVREDVLQWIIESDNPVYDSLYDPVKLKKQMAHPSGLIYHPSDGGFCDLPFMELSIRVLAKLRLAMLHAEKERINR
jgi:hypothetical protein